MNGKLLEGIRGRAVAIALLAAAAACGERGGGGEETVRFRIDETRFAVPEDHVRSIRREPPGFVRINDPESPVEIAFDARLQGRTSRRGAPLLFSINDGDYAHVAYGRTAQGALLACRRGAVAPHGGCGMPLDFEGAAWTVMIPEARIGEADALRRRAEALLRSYTG